MIEHRHERTITKIKGFSLVIFEQVQTGYGNDVNLGTAYGVHNDEHIIRTHSLDRAEQILHELIEGKRVLGVEMEDA